MNLNSDIITFLNKYNLDDTSLIFVNSIQDIEKGGIFKNAKIAKYTSFRNLNQISKSGNVKNINFIFTDKINDLNPIIFTFDVIKHTEYIYISSNTESKTHLELKEYFEQLFPSNWSLVNNFDENNFLFKNIEYRDSLILKSGAWDTKDMNEHVFDNDLADTLLEFFEDEEIKKIVDFGCGPGEYVKFFRSKNYSIKGYDGNPHTKELSNGICKVLDLTTEFELNKTFDCVLSLEVGEHIPKEYEQIYINNLVKYSEKYIIISWAIPNQGGYGHVNCQTNDYIKEEFYKRGFVNCIDIETHLRKNARCDWFKDTIMIFKKKVI